LHRGQGLHAKILDRLADDFQIADYRVLGFSIGQKAV
jgi:hypothetical protein